MLWTAAGALGTRTLLWFGQTCAGDRMLLQHARYYGLGMSGHRCTGDRMLLEHERHYGLGMDALVTSSSWNKNVAMVRAWMYW